MADQTQRLEIATVKAEVGSNILFKFGNDALADSAIPTQSGPIKNIKQVIADIQEEAEQKISIATTIYKTPAAGLAASTDGGIFLVQSNDASEIYTVWKNQAGAAVNTGKTAMSSQAIEEALTASNEAAQAAEDAADTATARTAGFLQPAAVAPTVRNNGLPLQEGDRYFNTREQAEYLYKSGAWAVNDSLEAIAELMDSADPQKGASQVGWDGVRVGDQIDLSRKIPDYTALRAYLGTASRVTLTKSGVEGDFVLDYSDTVTADNGGTVIVGQGNRRWKRQFVGSSNVQWFDQSSDSTDSLALQKSISEAQTRKASTIEVNKTINVATVPTDRSRVHLRGDGRLTGEGAYRKQVFPWNSQSAQLSFVDLDASKHLQRFSATKNPVVVLTGSSTGAWQPNSVDTASTVVRMLSERISKYNKDKAVKFYNRCIGGQSYPNLDTTPTEFPTWYADRTKPWLDYIKDIGPDVVFIIMGSGDSGDMSYARLKSVTDKLKGFAKAPDIVFITQPSVNPDPDPNYATFGTRAGQEGRDYAAGVIRSFALFNNYGFIDANRAGGIVLDGRDLMDTISERAFTSIALDGGYTSSVLAHDYSMRLRFTGDQAAIDAAFTASGNPNNPVFFRTGPGDKGDGRGGDIVYIRKSPTGHFQFEFFLKGDPPASNYASVTTDVLFPTSSFVLDIFKSGCTVGISVAGAEDNGFMMFPIISGGGEFAPQVGGRVSGGPFVWMDYLNLGKPKQYLPSLTSQQAWGEKSPDASTQLPWGGNGANHFSSLGTAFIYGPLLNRGALTASKLAEGTYTPLVGDVSNSATPVPSIAMWSRVGDTVTVSGMVNITPQASGTVQVDLTLPVPTTLAVPSDLAGTCGAGGVAGMSGSVWGNNALHRARVQLTTSVTSAQNVRYIYSYRIK